VHNNIKYTYHRQHKPVANNAIDKVAPALVIQKVNGKQGKQDENTAEK